MPSTPRSVLITGSRGFLAGYIVAELRARGWRVVLGVRSGALGPDERPCDFAQVQPAIYWRELLEGVDAVVNVAGILRESRAQRFDLVHHQGPLALAQACVDCGVRDFVQISALGDPADGEFIASKHRFDAELMALPLRAVVFRPSIVYALDGSYGGTSLLRAMAALPLLTPLPGQGEWQVQPLAVDELCELVHAALDSDAEGIFELGSPQPMSLRDYQLRWRKWLHVPGQRVFATPRWAVDIAVGWCERLGAGPMGQTMWRMLKRGNVCAPDAHSRLLETFGKAPSSLDDVLLRRASQVQDRWHARLYLLASPLRWAVVLLWLISAWAGLFTPAAQIETLAQGTLLESWPTLMLARFTGAVDLLLAAWLASGWRPQRAIEAMLALVLGYTAVFGLLVPALWLDPLGGLAKNLLVLPALAVLWVLSARR